MNVISLKLWWIRGDYRAAVGDRRQVKSCFLASLWRPLRTPEQGKGIRWRQLNLFLWKRPASLIRDDAVVSVSSSSGLGCPDATLRAIGGQFRKTGSPRNLTSIHPIAAGDMYGIDGINHLAQPGLLKRVIAGSFPNGPSSMKTPAIWQMICDDEIEAYCLPSGVLYHMHREAASRRPGGADQSRLGYGG